MKAYIEMDTQDFSEFLSWQKDKADKEREIREAREINEIAGRLESLAKKVTAALEKCEKGEYKIISQEAAAKLYAEARDDLMYL